MDLSRTPNEIATSRRHRTISNDEMTQPRLFPSKRTLLVARTNFVIIWVNCISQHFTILRNSANRMNLVYKARVGFEATRSFGENSFSIRSSSSPNPSRAIWKITRAVRFYHWFGCAKSKLTGALHHIYITIMHTSFSNLFVKLAVSWQLHLNLLFEFLFWDLNYI